jgi:hypothetical protein
MSFNNAVIMPEKLESLLMETSIDLAKRAIIECGRLYGFSGEEAIRQLNLGNVKISKKVKGKKSQAVAVPLPFNGSKKEGLCNGLVHNHGLYTQCEVATEEEFCVSCQVSVGEYGSIDDRCSVGINDYVDPKGRRPTAYMKVLKKLKLSEEAAKLEAEKQGEVIDALHFKSLSEGKRGRPASKEKVEKKSTSGKKGRPRKEKKVIHIEGDDEEDLFASLVSSAKVTEFESDTESVAESDTESLVESVVESLVESVVEFDNEAKKAEEEAAKEAAKKEKEAKKAEEEAAKEAAKKEKEAKKAEEEAAKEAAKKEKEAKKAEEEAAKEAAKKAKEAKKAEEEAAKEAAKKEKEAKKAEEEAAKKEKAAKKAEEEAAKEAAKKEKAAKKAEEEAAKKEKEAKKEPKTSKKEEEEESSEQPEVVKKIEYEGKRYLKSKKTGIVYDYAKYVGEQQQVVVGQWNESKNKIDFTECESDEEEAEDYEEEEEEEEEE